MARLTKWNGKKWVLPQNSWKAITERLVAYENTGLEPEEIQNTVKPLMYVIEVFSGDCYHKELWYGFPSQVEKRKDELRNMSKEWGWDEPTIIANQFYKEEENNDER